MTKARLLFLVGSVVLLANPPHWAQSRGDDCTMSLEALQPLLDTKAASVKKVLSTKKDLKHRRLTESMVLSDDVTVTYSVGGCEHYGYYLQYENVGSVPTKEKEAMESALRLLKKTPILKKGERANPLIILVDALEQTKKSANKFEKGALPLNCGHADCVLEVKEGTLTLRYDFAL